MTTNMTSVLAGVIRPVNNICKQPLSSRLKAHLCLDRVVTILDRPQTLQIFKKRPPIGLTYQTIHITLNERVGYGKL